MNPLTREWVDKAEADFILDAALAHLRAADPVLGGLIEQIGPYVLQRDPDHFYALFSSIVAQQISVRAAATIMGRVDALFPAQEGITAEGVLAASPEALRAVGLSSMKTRYVLDLAERVADGRLDLERLASLDDDAVIAELVQVRGIGRWTAEMFLTLLSGGPMCCRSMIWASGWQSSNIMASTSYRRPSNCAPSALAGRRTALSPPGTCGVRAAPSHAASSSRYSAERLGLCSCPR